MKKKILESNFASQLIPLVKKLRNSKLNPKEKELIRQRIQKLKDMIDERIS